VHRRLEQRPAQLLRAVLGQRAVAVFSPGWTTFGQRPEYPASFFGRAKRSALFASLDDEQREQLGDILLALRDGLAADPESADTAVAETAR
jgi:hypothetical protein